MNEALTDGTMGIRDQLARPEDKAREEQIEREKAMFAAMPVARLGVPTKFKVDKDLASRLRKLHEKQQGVQQFVAMVTRQGEERIGECVHEGQDIWRAIATRYGIDVENVSWNLDKDGETLIPVGMKL